MTEYIPNFSKNRQMLLSNISFINENVAMIINVDFNTYANRQSQIYYQ